MLIRLINHFFQIALNREAGTQRAPTHTYIVSAPTPGDIIHSLIFNFYGILSNCVMKKSIYTLTEKLWLKKVNCSNSYAQVVHVFIKVNV